MTDVVVSELLVFSDHHAHPFSYGAKEVLHGGVLTNSRLVESCNVLKQMSDYARAHNIRTVVFGGDLFHTRESVSTDAYNATLAELQGLTAGRQTFFLTGNHDYFDREGKVHSLEGLKYWKSDLTVVDWRSPLRVETRGSRSDSYTLCFVPYTEDKALAQRTLKEHADAVTASPKLLIAHLGMQGAKVGSDYVLVNDADVSVDDIRTEAFAGCLFGHYHAHQQLFGNGWYIGASHQHNWGDVNTTRGFLHVRVFVDHIDFTFIESDAPRFLAIKEADVKNTTIRKKDFVKVFTSKKMNDKELSGVRTDAVAESCEVVYVPPEISLSAIALDERHLTPSAMVETWVKANAAWLQEHLPGVEEADLVAYGRTVLAKVQGQNG